MGDDGFLSAFRFSEDSSAPLYAQVAEYLRHRIRSGALKSGDRMVAENDIVKTLGISRTTVRLAFDQLVDEGLIIRYRGKGTFVAEPKLKRNINYLYSFTENIRSSGAVPSSIVLRSEVIPADAGEKAKLKLDLSDAKIFLIERLRMANGEPLIVEKTCIPYYLCPGVEKIDFSSASLYAALRGQYGLNISRAEETIEAVILKKSACGQLDCAPGMPGYAIERISYLDSGYICEHTSSLTRADKCVFKLELTSNHRTREHAVDFERRMILGDSSKE